jgi:hypothetical protein
MRPELKRSLVILAAAASLLLCMATSALWVRSYTLGDTVDYVADAGERLRWWSIVSVHGSIGFHFANYDDGTAGGLNDRTGNFSYFSDSAQETGTVVDWVEPLAWRTRGSSSYFLGFGYGFAETRPWSTFRGICIPHWFLALLFAILPGLRLRAAIRSRRHRSGFCSKCGYDLRATPERCPECGNSTA